MIKSNKLQFLLIAFSLLFVFVTGCSLQQPEIHQNTGYISLSIDNPEETEINENARTIYPQLDTSLITNIRLYGTRTEAEQMLLRSWDNYSSMRMNTNIALVPDDWELHIELYYNYFPYEDTKSVTITADTTTPVKFTLSSNSSYGSLNLKIQYSDYMTSTLDKITATFSKYPSMELVEKKDLNSYLEDGIRYVQYNKNTAAGVYYILVTFNSAEGELNRYSNIVKIQNGFTSKKDYYISLNSLPLGYVHVYSHNFTINMSSSVSEVFNGRTISIPDLIVSDHEVTQGEWKSLFGVEQKNMNTVNSGWGDDYPVYSVNWYGAIAYCNKKSAIEGKSLAYTISGISYDNWKTFAYSSIPTSSNATWNAAVYNESADGWRLPTEAEWEYIARDGMLWSVQTLYSGSDDEDSVAWYSGNSAGKAHPVRLQKTTGTTSANIHGIFDMSGNVAEWCWDWKGTIDTSTGSTGPSNGEYRVVRGGGWNDTAFGCRVSYRDRNTHPEEKSNSVGFRIVHKTN